MTKICIHEDLNLQEQLHLQGLGNILQYYWQYIAKTNTTTTIQELLHNTTTLAQISQYYCCAHACAVLQCPADATRREVRCTTTQAIEDRLHNRSHLRTCVSRSAVREILDLLASVVIVPWTNSAWVLQETLRRIPHTYTPRLNVHASSRLSRTVCDLSLY